MALSTKFEQQRRKYSLQLSNEQDKTLINRFIHGEGKEDEKQETEFSLDHSSLFCLDCVKVDEKRIVCGFGNAGGMVNFLVKNVGDEL